MDYNEFRTNIQKKHHKNKFKINGSWGVYDAYKAIRKRRWYNIGRPLKEKEFYSIIRNMNNLLAKFLSYGETIILPAKMGKIELRKIEKGASIVNGKLKITYPINWEDTVRLWFEDEEARKNKTCLRFENKYIYRTKYCKYNANYENKSFYQFTLNKEIKKALKENINAGKTDTLW